MGDAAKLASSTGDCELLFSVVSYLQIVFIPKKYFMPLAKINKNYAKNNSYKVK